MAHKVTIECEARFVDHLSDESKKASESIDDIGSAAEQAQKKVDNLGKKKFRPIFDADNNKFLKKIREAEARAEKLGKTKTTMVLKVLDKATNAIGNALNKAQRFGGSVWNAILKVKDSQAMTAIKNVTSAGKAIAGKTWSAIVKIKDYATTPLQKIKDSLFSIKSLIAAVTAGFAAKKFVLDPINLADQYSSAKIGFSTLLGDKRGQEMMDEIDKFAKETPFKTSGVISNVQKMMAYGWDVERVIDDMKTIGDAAASTGRGDQGLESIVYALSEIRSKGKLSTQELNQLASAGIKAKQYLAQGLGYGTDDEGMKKLMADLERGAIGANQAIDLILQGMEEFDGMMDRTANETVEGLWSQIQDTFEINVFRKWGQGLQDGAKKGFGTIVDLLDSSEDAISSLGDTLYSVGKSMSNWAAGKLEKAVKTIKEVTNTDLFKNASLGGKIKILWNEVIAEPFSKWWNSEGKAKVAGIASDVGKGIGIGLTGGLLALLGFNAEDAIADGVSIGGSFMEGFLEGFDTSKITKALSDWVSDNKLLATVLGGALAFKLISGIAGGINSLKGLFGGSGDAGGTLLSAASAGTMNVTAGVVNVYGMKGNNLTDVVDDVADAYTAKKMLDAGSDGAKLLKAGDTVADATKALKAGDAAVDATKALTVADNAIDMDKLFGAGSKAAGASSKFAKMFPKLSKGLTKIAPFLSFLDFAVDGVAGYAKSKKEGDSTGTAVRKGVLKSITGDYDQTTVGGRIWSAISNTLKGAGVGALAGGPIGALIGGAAGLTTNVGAQLSNSKLPKWAKALIGSSSPIVGMSMVATEIIEDPGAFKEKISTFFTETLPNGWNNMWDSVGNFFTETVSPAASKVGESIENFFTETIPNAWNSFWDAVESFFTETVPYALGYATGKVVTFFSKTLPNAWSSFWDSVGTFFSETIPEWADAVWNDHIVPFFTEKLPAAWDTLWESLGTFFTETLPTWSSSVWNDHIVPFFTESIPGFFGSLWDGVCGLFDESIDFIAEQIWAPIKGFFTDTIPGWASSAIEKAKSWFGSVKENFLEGYDTGIGGGGKKARGGIVGGRSSSAEAFARGGRTDGGIIGGSTRFIRVNEESPEMIIPLSSQRRERAMKLWAKTGQLLGVPGFARGGNTAGDQDEGIRFKGFGTSETSGERTVHVEVGGIHIELKVEATDKEGVVQAIKEQLSDIAESVAGIFADEFEALFENTPVRGVVN